MHGRIGLALGYGVMKTNATCDEGDRQKQADRRRLSDDRHDLMGVLIASNSLY